MVYDIIFDRESADPAIDREFAAAIRRFRGVDADGNPLPGQPQRHVLLACGRKTFNRTGNAGEQLIVPTDTLLEAADDFGLVAVDDDEFIIRKLPTGSRDEPSLVWKAALMLGANLDESRRLDPRWINFAGPPPDSDNRMSNGPIPSCPADSVLLGGVDTGFFRNKIVVIGGEPGIVGEALGKDLFATPFHRFHFGGKRPLMSGVEVQVNGLANLLQGNWLTRSSPQSDLILVIAAGLLAGIGFSCIRPIRAVITAATLVLACRGGGLPCHAPCQGLVPVVRGRLPAGSRRPGLGHRLPFLYRTLLPHQTERRASGHPRGLRQIPVAADVGPAHRGGLHHQSGRRAKSRRP